MKEEGEKAFIMSAAASQLCKLIARMAADEGYRPIALVLLIMTALVVLLPIGRAVMKMLAERRAGRDGDAGSKSVLMQPVPDSEQ